LLVSVLLVAVASTPVQPAAADRQAPIDRAVAPRTWARSFCGAVTTWSESARDGASTLREESSASGANGDAVRAALVTYLGALTGATGTARRALRRAGFPDVARGERIARMIRAGFADVRDALEDGTSAAAAVPVTEAAAARAAAVRVQATIDDGFHRLRRALRRANRLDREEELREAMAAVRRCRALLRPA
jgi:hypothetical protein